MRYRAWPLWLTTNLRAGGPARLAPSALARTPIPALLLSVVAVRAGVWRGGLLGAMGQMTDADNNVPHTSSREPSRDGPQPDGDTSMPNPVDGPRRRALRCSGQQLAEAHQRDLDNEGEEGVHYEHAWLDPIAGKVLCLATGPSKEANGRTRSRAIRRPRCTRSRSRSSRPMTGQVRPSRPVGHQPLLVVGLVGRHLDVRLGPQQRHPTPSGWSPR